MGTSVPVLSGASGAPPPPATPAQWLGFSFIRTLVLTDPVNPGVPSSHIPGVPRPGNRIGATGICSCLWPPGDVIAAQQFIDKDGRSFVVVSPKKSDLQACWLSARRRSLARRQGEL